jgi:fructose-1,6-bisphosphatase/inositol monophosphatase family enzyme
MTDEMDAWSARLGSLCDRVRDAARTALLGALGSGELERIARPLRQGAGDVTYGLDECTEEVARAWCLETARSRALSLLTEDAGWKHFGPGPRGEAVELADFDHGGPRIALDPVDGTRNLMADLRSAWTVVSFAGPGRSQPRMSELSLGIVSEIPTARAAAFRRLSGRRGGKCLYQVCELDLEHRTAKEFPPERVLAPTGDARAEHGYFCFFRYLPDQRPALARVEAAFFERLARLEGADVRTCYDDQYISSGGQLALLALGTYRMVCDVRGLAGARLGRKTITTKPYDLAGAVVCARAAGCVVTAPDGSELDFPIDCATPVDFVGWTNEPTRRRLEPHLREALTELQ